MENLKDKFMLKEEQDSISLKRVNWNGSSLDSVLNRCLNFRWTGKGVVQSFTLWIIPAVINIFTKENLLR